MPGNIKNNSDNKKIKFASNKISLAYKYVIILTGIAILTISTYLYGMPDILGTISLIILAAIAESQSVPIGEDKSISVGFALDLCALLLYGPVTAAWVVFLSVLFSITDVKGKGHVHIFNIPLHSMLFNCSNLVISVYTAGKVYELFGGRYIIMDNNSGITGIIETLRFLSPHFISLILAIFIHIIINTGIIAIYLGIVSGSKALSHWIYNFRWSVINLFIVGIIGVTITLIYRVFGNIGLLLFMAPLLLARYTFVQYIKMREVYLNTIKALTAAIEAKDKYTMGHSQRVEKYSGCIAREMKLPPDRLDILRYAALLHDIGKIGINEIVLNKPGLLSKEEFELIRQHPIIGCRILEDVDFLKESVRVISSHHERYDGKGYPEGLDHDTIPIEAQIMSVADAYDAMTSDRPYRKAKEPAEAAREIKSLSGIQFSPKVVDAFTKIIKRGEI